MMSLKFVRDAQGPWKTVVRGLWVWEQQTWESQPRGTKVGTSHSRWTRYFSPMCWLLWMLRGPPRNPQKGREGESGTLQSPGPGREREDLIQGGIAPATWALTVTSVLPVFNVALLSLQWCLIGFFFLNSFHLFKPTLVKPTDFSDGLDTVYKTKLKMFCLRNYMVRVSSK